MNPPNVSGIPGVLFAESNPLEIVGVQADGLSNIVLQGYTEARSSVKYGSQRDFGSRWSQNCREGLHGFLGPAGYIVVADDGISRSVCLSRRVVIVAARGNEATGFPQLTSPLRTTSPRSPNIMRGVARLENGQMDLGSVFPDAGFPAEPLADTSDGYSLWFLLYNESGGVVRSEISRALGLRENGYPGPWGPRHILPAHAVGLETEREPIELDPTR